MTMEIACNSLAARKGAAHKGQGQLSCIQDESIGPDTG